MAAAEERNGRGVDICTLLLYLHGNGFEAGSKDLGRKLHYFIFCIYV